jgi:transporter family protein
MDMLSGSVGFAILAMLLWGIAPVFAKLGLGNLDPLAALTIRSGVITLALVGFVSVSGKWPSLAGASVRDVGFIALEGLCAALLGQLAYYYALKSGEVGKVTPTAAAFPLVALLVGVIVLGERITWGKLVGAAFIVVGIYLVNYR